MRTVTRAALVVLSTLSRSLTHPAFGRPDLMRLLTPPAAFVYSVYIAGQCKRAQPVLIHRTCKLWSVDSSRTCRLIPYRAGRYLGSSSNAMATASEPGEGGSKKKKAKKRRVDELLIEQGLADDAKHAVALVMSGAVIADDCIRIESAAAKVAENTIFRLKGQKAHRWVSRGGIKLDHAIEEFQVDVRGAVAIDVGCSHGGFTHVLLEKGAAKVYAVDVGYGQLDLTLRKDPRVVVMERTNARNLTEASVGIRPNLVVCDASFIPLRKVLVASLALCRTPAMLLALIKPQFEAEKHEVESGTGVVRDSAVHARVCAEVDSWLRQQGWEVKGLTKSPITGPNGNVEFIIWAELEKHTAETEAGTRAETEAATRAVAAASVEEDWEK